MATVTRRNERLRGTDGFLVESPDGDVGLVEEIWLDAADEPQALAVRTPDGRHALLPGEVVLAVDRDHRWVVVPERPELLELRCTGSTSWVPTGASLVGEARPPWRWPAWLSLPHLLPRLGVPSPADESDRPVWRSVVLLYASLALAAAIMMTLAFGL